MKSKTKQFQVNLVQGFIVDSKTDQIYAAYHSHYKAIVAMVPWTPNDFEIPTDLKNYSIHVGCTDSFSITGWTNDGDKDLYEIIQTARKVKK
jgi:hypothetical protein